MSSGMMERINRFSRRKKLSAGDRVVVYAKHPPQGTASDDAPAPLGDIDAPRPELLPGAVATETVRAPNGQRSVD
jgi:hypothetical protein